MKEQIYNKLMHDLEPGSLEVIDESYKHEGHPGNTMNGESHFVVLISKDCFEPGIAVLDAHKIIYKILKQEIKQIHALSIRFI